jgi:hypothetical protein
MNLAIIRFADLRSTFSEGHAFCALTSIPSSVGRCAPRTLGSSPTCTVQHGSEKRKVVRPRPEIIRGYGGMESEGLAYTQDEETPPDLKEVFDVGPMDVPNTEYYRGAALRRQSLA